MKKALILGSSVGSVDIVKSLQRRGIYTIVADYLSTEESKAKQHADEIWNVSTGDIDQLECLCREQNVEAVFAGVSEFNLDRSIELCARLGLPNPSSGMAWQYSRNKRDFKELCTRLSVPIPVDYCVPSELSAEELDAIVFPVVVKPVDMSGNKGISYCENKDELIAACEYARTVSSNPELIVERKIEGKEWYSYYAVAGGEASLVCLEAMYAQPDFPANIYSVTTTITSQAKKYVEEADPVVKGLLREAGCQDGIAWVQVMLDEKDNSFYVIEMGYRLDGGLVGIPAKELTKFDSIEWIVDCVLGMAHQRSELPENQTGAFHECATTYTLWVDRDCQLSAIDGLDEIRKDSRIRFDIHSKPGDTLKQFSTIGIMYFAADSVEETIEIIDMINRMLSVRDSVNDDVLIRYTNYQLLRDEYEKGFAAESQ